jgi:outer membrane protein assembly factor BamA
VFSEAQLIEQTRLNTGDIFDVSKVRDGLEEMRRRYARKGYIDCTIEPTIKLDDEKNLIDLTLRVQEERAYRVRSFEIFGLDENTRNRLSSQLPLAPGEIFDVDSVR